jgi:hypothetical protein
MKGMKLPKNLKGDINPRNMQQNIAQASSMLCWPGRCQRPSPARSWAGRWRVPSMLQSLLLTPTAHVAAPSPWQMSRMLPPHMLKMMGGPAAIQSLIKQMEGKF